MLTVWARRGGAIARAAPHAIVLPVLAVALIGVLPQAWTWAVGALVGNGLAAGPVYSVAALQRQVARDPAGWVGRTVLVQGWAVVDHARVDPNTVDTLATLVDAPARGWLPRLPVVRGRADAALAWLRRMPLLGRFAPRPQVLQPDRPATYRVQLRFLPDTPCAACVEAVLLDAA